MTNPEPRGETRTFLISVAAELAGMHAQTLRTYDRLGLVRPQRSSGGGRRYSERDVELLLAAPNQRTAMG
ncbi:MAG TPA: MerR family DNA-binding transcriptional regulator, partial [Mycolicibacterium fallax]|nr:MerR family DNA-binding transcriptional regulator [Mycolicibacterium fallax]